MEIKIRVRGEYSFTSTGLSPIAELPPRARRIPFFTGYWVRPVGTTSACAENTLTERSIYSAARNYLRVRGEYWLLWLAHLWLLELPPRARRIRGFFPRPPPKHGTTSACAENTFSHVPRSHRCRNYLRVRGEYYIFERRLSHHLELPPRARRIPSVDRKGL